MRPPQKLHVSPEQRQELEEMRDRAPLPYMRERAAALLKIADGMPPLEVANHGLFRRRDSEHRVLPFALRTASRRRSRSRLTAA